MAGKRIMLEDDLEAAARTGRNGLVMDRGQMRPRLLAGAIPALRSWRTCRGGRRSGGKVVMAQAITSSSAAEKMGRSASAAKRVVVEATACAAVPREPATAAMDVQTLTAPPR